MSVCSDLGKSCKTENDCHDGQVCLHGFGTFGVCAHLCKSESDCKPGQKCIEGYLQGGISFCENHCKYDSDCPIGEECVKGMGVGGWGGTAICMKKREDDGGTFYILFLRPLDNIV